MNNEKNLEILNEIFSKNLKIPAQKLNDDVSIDEESSWDSVTHLMMISEIENKFEIKFTIDEIVSLDTLGAIRKIVNKKTEQHE